MTAPATLPKPLKTRINRLAHLLGTQHAERERAAIIARLVALRKSGAGFAELDAELSRLEAASQGAGAS
ncbi:hypothetical protein [Xenophilus sp. Marseille-Q4582]|uniref:hypothetical protein n=1 Tax=Xenophilus sp. Marseille-Q4582 TaxID=2866600 RepID=UPI001CE41CDD|nr:hypothetical protein [Xenophilus sp. Marseille-Q4582]